MFDFPLHSHNLVRVFVHDTEGQLIIAAYSMSEFWKWCEHYGRPEAGQVSMTFGDNTICETSVPEFFGALEAEYVRDSEAEALRDQEPDWYELDAAAYGSVYGRSTPIIEVDPDADTDF
jgi:hypothetical protein